MNIKKTIAIVAVMALAVGAFAQRQGGMRMMGGQMGGSPVMLLSREDVREELKISDEQKGKLSDLQQKIQDKMREAFQNSGFQPGGGPPSDDVRKKMQETMQKVMEDINKDVNGILNADQQKRLKELSVQRQGNSIVMNPEYQKELGVTDAQKAKLTELQKKSADANRQIMEKVMAGEMERSESREAMQKNGKILNEEIGKLLTDDQKKKLADMAGKPFTFKDENQG